MTVFDGGQLGNQVRHNYTHLLKISFWNGLIYKLSQLLFSIKNNQLCCHKFILKKLLTLDVTLRSVYRYIAIIAQPEKQCYQNSHKIILNKNTIQIVENRIQEKKEYVVWHRCLSIQLFWHIQGV